MTRAAPHPPVAVLACLACLAGPGTVACRPAGERPARGAAPAHTSSALNRRADRARLGQAGADAPTLSPIPGVYAGSGTVTLAASATGASIHYTLDGSAPTASSPAYSAPLVITGLLTIRALTTAPGLADSAVVTGDYRIVSAGSGFVDRGAGFSASGLTLNGAATLAGRRLRLTDGAAGEVSSAFFSTPLDVRTFTASFDFQLSQASGEGFTFTLQGASAAALGPTGGGLGYGGPGGGIARSVAIKFDLADTAGEGINSVGLYLNGAPPTTPSLSLAATGVDLHSGNLLRARLDYDGARLSLGLTDTATGASAGASFAVDIPAAVGGASAWVGFTAASSALTAVQDVLGFAYAPGIHAAAMPTISPPGGSRAVPLAVTLASATPGAVIHYTLDGAAPSASSPAYSAPFLLAAAAACKALAIAPGLLPSGVAEAAFRAPLAAIDDGAGFDSARMQLNGSASRGASRLTLTDAAPTEVGTAFTLDEVDVRRFTTRFAFQLTAAGGDGFAFVLQGVGPTAKGVGGGGLGVGGIGSSVAFKFDLYSNAGEGANSTGIYTGGQLPTVPATDLTAAGIDLHSGDVFEAEIVYDGSQATLALVDLPTGAAFHQTFTVDIPTAVGASAAWVGFTGATGGQTAIQQILRWTWSGAGAAVAPAFSIFPGEYLTARPVSLASSTPGAAIYYTTDGTRPTAASSRYTSALTISTNTVLSAIALAPGLADSPVAVAAYAFRPPAPVFVPPGATSVGHQDLALSDGLPAAVIHYTTDGTSPSADSPVYTGPLSLTATATIQAVALADGLSPSAISSASFVIRAEVPAFDPPPGTTAPGQLVTLTDKTPGAVIHYTIDGSAASADSPVYAAPLRVDHPFVVRALATAPGLEPSAPVVAAYLPYTLAFDHSAGFAGSDLQLNGSAALSGTRLRLTPDQTRRIGSAFERSPAAIGSFTVHFAFQLTQALADGFIFVIQANGPEALGQGAGGLGYGPEDPNGQPVMGRSVALKFDLYANNGEGSDSTGLYQGGVSPTVPALDLDPSGIDLHGGDPFAVGLAYDGAQLTLVLTDQLSGARFARVFAVDIPAAVGGQWAWLGFTASTGGATAIQDILSWSYAKGAVASPPPTFSLPSGTYRGAQTLSLPGPAAFFTLDGSTPTAASPVYTRPLSIGQTTTVKAFAVAAGQTPSEVAVATYVIESATAVDAGGEAAPDGGADAGVAPAPHAQGGCQSNGGAGAGAALLAVAALALRRRR